ncbi:MAG: amidase family protein, partial [Pseudomonadota bacterium]
ALSTGMVPIADGSDMMGSLRNPAGWTNTYGLRPSFGLVPSEPVADTFLHQISTNGPMGRSPQDIELLMRVMSGPDPRQPHGRRPRDTAAPQRIAWLGDWGGAFPMEEGLLETCERALSHFTDCDCYVEPLDPPFSAEALWESWTTLRSWTVGASLAPLMADASKRALLKPAAIWEGERGLALSAMDVHRASVTRSEWFMAAATLFETYDALLLPTAQMWPFPAEWDWPREIAGHEMDTYHRWMEVTVPASFLGLPALSLPAGFSEAGLPIGMQLIGPRGSDIGLLDLGQSWHLTVPWATTRPPVVRASEPS